MQHPVIVLPGTYFTDLCALVTFMYSGEVNIYEHQLAGLLSVAETLQIRGLAEFTWVSPHFYTHQIKIGTLKILSVNKVCFRLMVGFCQSLQTYFLFYILTCILTKVW